MVTRTEKLKKAYDPAILNIADPISWLFLNNQSLNNRRPIDIMDTDEGLDSIMKELKNIQKINEIKTNTLDTFVTSVGQHRRFWLFYAAANNYTLDKDECPFFSSHLLKSLSSSVKYLSCR